MKKPAALIQLIEELHEDGIYSEVETDKASQAIIFLSAADAKNNDGIKLCAEDCYVLFANQSTVIRLKLALESPKASLTLHNVIVKESVLNYLERKFVAVDES